MPEIRLSPYDFGAIADGLNHKLSDTYATLADAQVDFPYATSLNDQVDWCAIKAAIEASKDYQSSEGSYLAVELGNGHYKINKTIYTGTGVSLFGMGVTNTKIKAVTGFSGECMIRMDRGAGNFEDAQLIDGIRVDADGKVQYCILTENVNEHSGVSYCRLMNPTVAGFCSRSGSSGAPANFFLRDISGGAPNGHCIFLDSASETVEINRVTGRIKINVGGSGSVLVTNCHGENGEAALEIESGRVSFFNITGNETTYVVLIHEGARGVGLVMNHFGSTYGTVYRANNGTETILPDNQINAF